MQSGCGKNNKIMVVGSLSAYLFGGCRQAFFDAFIREYDAFNFKG